MSVIIIKWILGVEELNYCWIFVLPKVYFILLSIETVCNFNLEIDEEIF